VADGLSSADLRQRAAVGTAVANGRVAAPRGPLDDVLRQSEVVQAAKLAQEQLLRLEAGEIRAQTEKIRAEVDLGRAEEMRRRDGGAGRPTDEYLLTRLDELRVEIARNEAATAAAHALVFKDRVQRITDEIARLQRPPAPSRVYADINFERWLASAQALQEDHRFEAEKSLAALQSDLELKREERAAEEARAARQAETKERLLTEHLPKALDLGQNFLSLWLQRGAGPAPAPVGALGFAGMPPGPSAFACEQCQRSVPYQPGAPRAVCPGCGQEYLGDDQGADMATPAGGNAGES